MFKRLFSTKDDSHEFKPLLVEIDEEPQNIMAAQLTAEHRVACMIGSMNLENQFCNVETND